MQNLLSNYSNEYGMRWGETLDPEVTEQNREWYRQYFSAIFSDFYLFDRCLGFNHTNLDQEVERYLKQLQLDYKVQVKGVFVYHSPFSALFPSCRSHHQAGLRQSYS